MAKEKLAGGEFDKVTAAVGEGADDAMAMAQSKTEAGEGGGGLMGALGGLTGGGGGLGGALGGMGGHPSCPLSCRS